MSGYPTKFHKNNIVAQLHPIPKICIPWHSHNIHTTSKLRRKNNTREWDNGLLGGFINCVNQHTTHKIDYLSFINVFKPALVILSITSHIIPGQRRCFTMENFQNFCKSKNITLHILVNGSIGQIFSKSTLW